MLVDQHKDAGKNFGRRRFLERLASRAREAAIDPHRRLVKELEDHRQSQHKCDDITIPDIPYLIYETKDLPTQTLVTEWATAPLSINTFYENI